jgi:thiamine-monophosphate kinase|tara:strand:- start:2056 stop:3015 length:960 start_codon:yes stop_codon:yes gene_type:complete
MHEFQLIKNYFSKLSLNNKISLELNDDISFDKSKQLAISVDTYVEGIHFINFKKPDLVIKKILRSSISDLICKGVEPKYYYISGSGSSKNFSSFNLKKILKSLKQEQKKFNILLSGGDTVFSNKLSFSITSVGFSKKIVLRNSAKLNDDIYVTGNLGDSYTGLQILKKKIKTGKKLKKYFENKYYQPVLCLSLTKKLLSIANTSIDISDGLIADLDKLINKQKLSYNLNLNAVPISKNLKKLISLKKMNKASFISQGDDYQVLFTAHPSKSRIINKIAKSLNIKISKIGKICTVTQKSKIIDQKGYEIDIKQKGFYHKF